MIKVPPRARASRLNGTPKLAAARSGNSPAASNPLMARWTGRFALPPFDRIEPRHFKPALEAAFRAHRAEIDNIANNTARPTFTNTIVALEKSGRQLSRAGAVFSNLESTDSTPELQEIARAMSPRFAAHETRILLDAQLFQRIDTLYQRRDALKLNDEDRRVLERHHLTFVRAGARLSRSAKVRVKQINARLASLVTQFMQNVLKDEQSWQLVLAGERPPSAPSDNIPPPDRNNVPLSATSPAPQPILLYPTRRIVRSHFPVQRLRTHRNLHHQSGPPVDAVQISVAVIRS